MQVVLAGAPDDDPVVAGAGGRCARSGHRRTWPHAVQPTPNVLFGADAAASGAGAVRVTALAYWRHVHHHRRALPRHHLRRVPRRRPSAWSSTAARPCWTSRREDIQPDLDRRRPGQSRLVTQRDETDTVEILSGASTAATPSGSPIAMLVRNKDQVSGAYDHMADLYRPSHADWTTEAKYGIRAVAGGGRASARETIGRVAAAAVARKLLAERVGRRGAGLGEQVHGIDGRAWTPATVTPGGGGGRPHPVPGPGRRGGRSPRPSSRPGATATRWAASVTCVARGVPAGLGRAGVRQARGRPGQGGHVACRPPRASRSAPGSRPVEHDRTRAQRRLRRRARRASPHRRPTTPAASRAASPTARTSLLRVAFKPTATIASAQQTVTRRRRGR